MGILYLYEYNGIFTLPAGAAEKYCDEYVCLCVCLWVCLSVRLHEDISGTTRAIFTYFYACCLWPYSSVLLRHIYDRPPRLSPGTWKGFSSPLKMHYRPAKGDGRAQRGRSMLSTIALLWPPCVADADIIFSSCGFFLLFFFFFLA